MGLSDVTADAVRAAVDEYTMLGQDDFLAKYGFGRARKFVLVEQGRSYDSKAIVGAAHQHATGQALPASAFSGGEQTVVARLAALGFDIRDTSAQPGPTNDLTVGEIPGVEIGMAFGTRREVADARVHRAIQAGIVGTGATGAESIVVSGGYEDDQDNGWEIVYTGHGGRDESGRQVADQTFDASGNAALQTSHFTGAPVRVVRGAHRRSAYAPQSGYRYDGLFRVVRVWRERGLGGHLICRFTMVALAAGPVAAESASLELVAPDDPRQGPAGTDAPDRRAATVQRLVRSVQVAEYIKRLYDHTCQACGTRLIIGSRPYSETQKARTSVGSVVPTPAPMSPPTCSVSGPTATSCSTTVRYSLTMTWASRSMGTLPASSGFTAATSWTEAISPTTAPCTCKRQCPRLLDLPVRTVGGDPRRPPVRLEQRCVGGSLRMRAVMELQVPDPRADHLHLSGDQPRGGAEREDAAKVRQQLHQAHQRSRACGYVVAGSALRYRPWHGVPVQHETAVQPRRLDSGSLLP